MKRSVSLAAACMIATSVSAFAADLPTRQAPAFVAPPPVPAVFAWTGPYVGLNVGYGGGEERYSYSVSADPVYYSGYDSQHSSGVVGGAQVGYNYEIGNSFLGGGLVVGAEADFDETGISNGALLNIPDVYARVSSRLNYFGTARGRFGVAFNRVMAYATGGFAYGHTSSEVYAPFNYLDDHSSHLHTGYTVGGGFEFAVTNNILLRAEYLRLDLGSKSSSGGDYWMNYNLQEHPIENIVRVGVDYKFDIISPIAPVVARY